MAITLMVILCTGGDNTDVDFVAITLMSIYCAGGYNADVDILYRWL